jgi:ADP-heptose:LPS heptosyltransferase
MSLPFILKLDKIHPNKVNYINTDETLTHKWKETFKPLKKYKVGFVYNGLLSSFIEKNIPLINFETLTDLDIELICIHKKSDILTDISNLSNKVKDKIHFYDIDNDKPFLDTIHILLNIDLLITIDTYIVHLAGILNIKTWLLLGNYSEWRWSNRDETYWYNSVELIRMKEKKELKNILGVVKNKLIEVLYNQKIDPILDKQKQYETFVYEI